MERLESLIATGKPLPLTKNVIVDREQALNLIDEMRISLPQEIEAAQRINSDRERIIELAQQEAEQVIARAQEQAAFLIEERGLTQVAEEESRRLVAQAQQEADDIRQGADEYAVTVLDALREEVAKTLRSIEKGISLLDDRRAQLREEAAASRNGQSDDEAFVDDEYDDDQYEDEAEGASQPVRR